MSTPYSIVTTADLAPGASFERDALGARARLSIPLREGPGRTFHGVVTEIEQLSRQIDGSRAFELVIEPRLAELRETRHRRIFHEQTSVDVVRGILREHGVTHRLRLLGTYPTHVHRLQYDESDLAFIERILFEEGIFYFFDHPPQNEVDDPDATNLGTSEVMVLCDTAEYYPELLTRTLVHRGSSTDGGSSGDPTSCFDVTRRRRVRTAAAIVRGRTVAVPSSPLGDARDDRGAPGATPDATFRNRPKLVVDHEGSLEDRPAAVRPSSVLLDEVRCEAVESSIRSHCPHAMPGRTFHLDGSDDVDAAPEHVISAVDHRGEAPRQFTDGSEGPTYENTMTTAPRPTALRASRRAKPRCDGFDTAVVVGPEDQEIWTDELGRVKVQFVWDLEGDYDERSSAWLRVAQSWAGAGFGAQFLPRVGMEVLVGFVAGDVDRPIVVGCLHNGGSPPPFHFPEERTKSGFRTRTSVGGGGFSELVIDDRRDAESVSIRSERALAINVLGDHSLLVGGASTERFASVDLEVGGPATYRIAEDHTEHIGGSERRNIAGDVAVTIGRNLVLGVAEAATVRVGGEARVQVEDSLDVLAGVGDDGGVLSLRAGTNVAIGAGWDTNIVSGHAIRLRVKDSLLVIDETGVHIDAPRFSVKAERIDLVGGGASLLLAGQVGLTGGEVVVSSKGAQLKLDADAHLDGAKVLLNCGPGSPSGATAGLSEERGTLVFEVIDPSAMAAGRTYTMKITGPDGTTTDHPVGRDGRVEVEGYKGDRFTLVELLCDGEPVGMTEV